MAFFNSLSKATLGAFAFAILSLQQGLQSELIENQLYNGTSLNGVVTVIIDDGSGATPSGTISLVANALNGSPDIQDSPGVRYPGTHAGMNCGWAYDYDHGQGSGRVVGTALDGKSLIGP